LIIFISSIFEELQFINEINKNSIKDQTKNKDIQLEHGVLHLHTGIRLQIQCSTVYYLVSKIKTCLQL
jgi:hypothetical protein